MTRHSHRAVLVLALLSSVATLAVAARPAEAGVSFHAGGGFSVGGLRFHVGVHDHDPVRYYRVDRPLVVAGVRCTDRCYVRRGYHYHDASCPLLRAYFHRHGYRPVEVYDSYVPRPYVVHPAPRHGHRVRVHPHDHWYGRRHATGHHRHDHRYDHRRDHHRHRYDHDRHDRRHHYDRDRHDRRDHRRRSRHHDHRHHR